MRSGKNSGKILFVSLCLVNEEIGHTPRQWLQAKVSGQVLPA
jgi:hypothetical protein